MNNKNIMSFNLNNGDWLDYSGEDFPIKTFRQITQFDLLSSTVSIPNNYKTYINNETLNWLKYAERNNKIPQNYQKKINLSPYTTFSKKKSYRAFIDKKISFKDFSTILYKAYGYDRSTMTRGYGSGGALYPVNVIIFILNDKTVENLPNGIYYFQPLTNNLYKLNSLSNFSNKKLKLALYPSKRKPDSNIVIGYAIDLRKVIRKYKYLGYKNALIELGLMAQSLKNTLPNCMGEYSCQDFNNRLLTSLANLDIKNAPIEMVQWLGYIKNE